MNKREFKEKNKELLDSWVVDLISSGFGVLFVALSYAKDFDLRGRIILFIFGLLFQIPLFYSKLYKYFFPKEE